MDYIVISNRGVADPMGMRLMGASTKDEHQIGRFGTGWKYGIASAHRLCGPFAIWLGTERIDVGTTAVELRGTTHRELTLNDQPIGVTDQLGKDWEPWMVLREFISNAIDEGDPECWACLEGDFKPSADRTSIVLPFAPFAEVMECIDDYFILGPVQGEVKTEQGRAFPKRDPNEARVYKKGVLVKRVKRQSAFDYELDVPLGEDRLAGDIRAALWTFLDKAPVGVKRAVITSAFEADAYHWSTSDPSWLEAFGDRLIVSSRYDAVGDALIVPYIFVELAERVGARTLKSDKAARDAKRKTMPASLTVRDVCKKLARKGIDVNPALVLMAEINEDYIVEKGLTYLKKDLADPTEALILAGTQGDGWQASLEQLRRLAALIRTLGKL